nr:MAK10-like protein [Tanacetum cinerariifolium]
MGDTNPIRTLGDYSKPSHEGYRNTIELPVRNNVVPLPFDTIRLVQNGCSFHGLRFEDPNQHLKDFLKLVDSLDFDGEKMEITRIQTIDQSAGGKLRDRNVKESWELLEDLALYDNKSWNDPRDFAKPVKVISLPQDVPSTSDRCLIELEKQYCMENPEQSFVDMHPRVPTKQEDSSIDSEPELEGSSRIMAGRSTRINTANNINPPSETADKVTRQLNTALPNLLTQLVQALRGNRANQIEEFPKDEPSHYRRRKSPKPILAIEGNPNPGNNRNRAHGRAFALGVAEAPQDPNIMTGTFSLNDHFATVLFDSDADYTFISTNFLPLINMKPSVISPDYEIEIASGLKVVTNMIVRGCRLKLEGHKFIIDLIPFGHGSLDVIVGMDCDYDCEIHYHPDKANVVADALSGKERMKPRRARAMSTTIHFNIKARILEAQSEASKGVNIFGKMLKGCEKQFERKEDIILYLA